MDRGWLLAIAIVLLILTGFEARLITAIGGTDSNYMIVGRVLLLFQFAGFWILLWKATYGWKEPDDEA